MTDLLYAAFRALGGLGGGPGRFRDVELVAAGLRATRDQPTLALLDAAAVTPSSAAYDEVERIAVDAGANGLICLDLVTEYSNPGCHAHLGHGVNGLTTNGRSRA